MRGDCSIRVAGIGFTEVEIEACRQRGGLLSIELELQASNDCRCAACESDSREIQKVLTLQEIHELVRQAGEMGCRRFILVNDETAVCPALQQLVEDARALGMTIELFTSGAGITPAMAALLNKHQVDVSLKLDSLDRDLQNRLAGSYQAYDTLHGALANLKQSGYNQPGSPVVSIRTAIRAENLDELPTLWRWVRSCGMEPRLQIITPRDANQQPPHIIQPEIAKKLFEDLGRIDRDEFQINWAAPPSLIGRSCKRHLYACHVTACGTIFPCVGVTIPIGNLRISPLREILNQSEVLENLRAFKKKVKEPCRTCCKTTDCYGCRGQAFQLTGDYLAGDSLCWKAKSTEIPSLPVEVGQMIPHGPSMRVVDRLVQIGEHDSTTEYVVTMDSPMVDAAGLLDELSYIEMIAQSFAASHRFHLSDGESPMSMGLLLGIKSLAISGEARVGDKLRIRIRKLIRFGDFAVVEGIIHRQDGKLIASGELKLWRPGDVSRKSPLE